MLDVLSGIKMKIGKPLFENIFGENNTIKVLDFLFLGKEFDFTITQISKGTGLSRTAVRNAIDNLLNYKMVEQSREDDKSKYFKINTQNNKFSLLDELYNKLKMDIVLS